MIEISEFNQTIDLVLFVETGYAMSAIFNTLLFEFHLQKNAWHPACPIRKSDWSEPVQQTSLVRTIFVWPKYITVQQRRLPPSDLGFRFSYMLKWLFSSQGVSFIPIINKPPSEKTNHLTCAPNEDSTKQIGQRIRAVWSNSSLSAWRNFAFFTIQNAPRRRFWSDCANAQSDLNLCWAHMSNGTFSDNGALLFYSGIKLGRVRQKRAWTRPVCEQRMPRSACVVA